MKFTCSAIVFFSCFYASSAFLQPTFIQHATLSSPSSCGARVKVSPAWSLSASGPADGMDVEGDMLGLFDDDDPDEEEIAIFKDADIIFSLIDVDGNGAVTREEISTHLTASGYTDKVTNQIFTKMDTNKDNEISKEEFRSGMVEIEALQTAPGFGNYNAQFVKEINEDADQVFQSADIDGNGEIEESELKNHLRRTLPQYTEEAVNNIFRLLDRDGDKKISKEELRTAFVRCSALRQAIGEGPNYK